MLRIFVFFILISGLFTSCGEQPYYEKVYSFKNNTWSQRVKPRFVVDIKDISKPYNFIVTIRTTTDYKYSNLWMYMNTLTPSGEKGREPFQMYITNPDGTWTGIKTGTVVENSLYFKKRKLPKKGKYVFTLEQGITESVIDEILDIDLRVEEAK
ncbi:MAG: gliding motility lipoprotein GldH [Flavobacteriia bacterium]|nr:gliding motility lipoprotein GldH [Flavobacteriia bacterium]